MLSTAVADYRNAAKTIYGITDKRIVTVTVDQQGGANIEYYVPTPGSQFECVALHDGSGDLTYAKRRVKDGEGGTQTESSTLMGIPNVREVEHLLWKTFLS